MPWIQSYAVRIIGLKISVCIYQQIITQISLIWRKNDEVLTLMVFLIKGKS